MRAEPLPQALVPAFGGEVAVQLSERRREAVRVAQGEDGAARVPHLDQVAEQVVPVVEPRLEDAAAPVDRGDAPAEVRQHGHLLRVGSERAHDDPVAVGMHPEDGMRVGVREIQQAPDLLVDLGERRGAPHLASSRSVAGMLTQSGRCPTS